MAKYRKKPVEVEAWLITEHNVSSHPVIKDRAMLSEVWFDMSMNDGRYYINTLEGQMTINEGDYLIKGIQGEFYPCKPNIFKRTYEKVH